MNHDAMDFKSVAPELKYNLEFSREKKDKSNLYVHARKREVKKEIDRE